MKPTLTLFTALLFAPLTALYAADAPQPAAKPAPGSPPESEDGLHRYDDRAVCFDPDWQYTGVGGKTRWGRCSEKAGAKVEFDFLGTAVELVHSVGAHDTWGVVCPDSNQPFGLACVEIDGRPAAAIPDAVGTDAEGRAVIDTSRGRLTDVAGRLGEGYGGAAGHRWRAA